MQIKIAASILSADFGKLNEEISRIEPFVDLLHVDVMDGHFVPNITIGPPVIKCLKTKLQLDTHLMIENPEKYIEDFVKAGCGRIVVHQEACKNLRQTLQLIRSFGVEAGVSIKPKTPIESILNDLDLVNEVLIMTVEPGFGGQKFMPEMISKVEFLKKLSATFDIAVDGGINNETAQKVTAAGANLLVSGSYLFAAKNLKEAAESLRRQN